LFLGSPLARAALLPPISVDGRDWLQPVDFEHTSWYDVAAVCDPTSGVCSGSLNGESLDGWYWASRSDVRHLFNYFLPPGVQMGPGDLYPNGFIGSAALDILLAGFLTTSSSYDPGTGDSRRDIVGLTRTLNGDDRAFGGWVLVGNSVYVLDGIQIGSNYGLNTRSTYSGHWFFRGPAFPAPGVPVPASWLLICLGLTLIPWALRSTGREPLGSSLIP